jgi:peptide/nickel transport system permease protein
VGIGLTFGLALGLIAATREGSLLDEAIMRLCDFTFAFPAVLTAILILTFLGPGLVNAIIAIGIFNIPVFARMARGAALQVLARDFIRAARAAGLTTFRILTRHVLPNITGLIIVQASVQFALAILAEAGLSYLGIGTQPPNPSWGRMLNDSQTFLAQAPHLALFPGAAIALAVLGFNLLGDGLRDVLDPKSKER